MSEPAARRVILAQAIETADTDGKLLPPFDRAQIDSQARQAAGVDEGSGAVAAEHFLDLRAQRVIGAVAARHPALAALQAPGGWQRGIAIATPLAALVLGVLTEVVANPHRVDLVSLPLLGIVAWNLAIYLLLIVELAVPAKPGWLAGVGRWTDGARALRRGSGNLRMQVIASFHQRWYRATALLHGWRIKRVLHLAAAAWAVGVALSLLVRGLVVEYRVGWESTFLDAAQVHSILSLLRLPAALVMPVAPFSVQEVAALQFSHGGGAAGGARWVYMYVALLLVLVIIPRCVLAAIALLRERMLARNVPIDLGQDYYRRLTSLLQSTRVHLCLVAPRAQDRTALMKVLLHDGQESRTLVRTDNGDVLRLIELAAPQVLPRPAASRKSWTDRARSAFGLGAAQAAPAPSSDLQLARDLGDIVCVTARDAGDLRTAAPVVGWLGKPVLVVVMPGPAGADASLAPDPLGGFRQVLQALPVRSEVIAFDAFALSWIQEKSLLDAMVPLLAQDKRPGFGHIAAAWEERNRTRLRRSMLVLADQLLFAARQSEQVGSSALTVRNLLPAERQQQAQARREAIDAVTRRLDESAAQAFVRLRKLHDVDDAAALDLQHELEEKFLVQQPVDSPQAGMAGAATGAAMGASVDLMVGGLSLGAATALGALVGGSAAFIAAAWKNRSAAGDATVVQLSDAMMQAMVEAGLLRYLAVAHHDRGVAGAKVEPQPAWRDEVGKAVRARAATLSPYWTSARTQPDAGRLGLALARELEFIAGAALAAIWPAATAAG